MRRLLVLAVLVVAVAAGVFAGDGARLGDTPRAYTLTEANNAGLISADDLAGNGCVPAGPTSRGALSIRRVTQGSSREPCSTGSS